MAKVYIALPAYNQTVTVHTLLSICALQKALLKRDIACQIVTLSIPFIDLARSTLLTMWYDTTDWSHLLFVDADMGFKPKLVLDMLAFNQPVVGAIYPRRDGDGWVGSGLGEWRGDFVRADGIGLGCTLIKRELIDLMPERSPDLLAAFDPIYRGQWIREDQAFCLRLREHGVELWAHGGEPITHVGLREHKGTFKDTEMSEAA